MQVKSTIFVQQVQSKRYSTCILAPLAHKKMVFAMRKHSYCCYLKTHIYSVGEWTKKADEKNTNNTRSNFIHKTSYDSVHIKCDSDTNRKKPNYSHFLIFPAKKKHTQQQQNAERFNQNALYIGSITLYPSCYKSETKTRHTSFLLKDIQQRISENF